MTDKLYWTIVFIAMVAAIVFMANYGNNNGRKSGHESTSIIQNE
jgi:hypothetical protein